MEREFFLSPFFSFHAPAFSASMVSPHTDDFLDLLASSQSRRLDDQRASASNLPGLRLNQRNGQSVLGHLMASNPREPDDDFFDILIKCQVGLSFFFTINMHDVQTEPCSEDLHNLQCGWETTQGGEREVEAKIRDVCSNSFPYSSIIGPKASKRG